MGLMQNLVEGYELNFEKLNYKYPILYTSITNKADPIFIIHINKDGDFLRVEQIEKDNSKKENTFKAIIPVSMESMNRTSTMCSPHILCDQFKYVGSDDKFHDAYLTNLENFAESEFTTDDVRAVYRYVQKGTIKTDLKREYDAHHIKNEPKVKNYVLFSVEYSGEEEHKIWEYPEIIDAWQKYYNKLLLDKIKTLKNNKFKDDDKEFLNKIDIAFDYITGKTNVIGAFSHPKKISNSAANAKLISDNDKTNFTFRGKFESSDQALSIGYESSQKAHQFLRYIIDNNAIYCREQTIIAFAVKEGTNVIHPPVTCEDFEDEEEWGESANQDEKDLLFQSGRNYAKSLQKALLGLKLDSTWHKHPKVCIVILNAATNGRYAITFYRELLQDEYLERIKEWHESMQWNHFYLEKKNKKLISYIGAPSIDDVIEVVFGKRRGASDESFDKNKKTARETLIRTIFDNSEIPPTYLQSAINRVSNPLSIIKKEEKSYKDLFLRYIRISCSLINHYNHKRKEKVFDMSIDSNCTDRSYLYGRLLGAADKLEEYALQKKDNKRVVTSALRYMQMFSQRPFNTWKTIFEALNPYMQQVRNSIAFNELQKILQLFTKADYSDDSPLNGNYIIGYFHEREYIIALVKELHDKQEDKDNNNSDNND